MKYAAIDFGTNSLRMLVAEERAGRLVPLFTRLDPCRLGAGCKQSGKLSPEGKSRACQTLAMFLRECREIGARVVGGIGTEALRRARDGREFLARVDAEFGLAVEIISGEREAQYTWRGVTALLPQLPEPSVIIDIGGGSTEVIRVTAGELMCASLDLGCVTLQEQYLRQDPPSAEELASAARASREALAAAAGPAAVLVGVGGTVTTFAALALALEEYDPAPVHGSRLPRATVSRLARLLARMTMEERELFPVLGPGRSDIIISGGLILQAVMELCGSSEMIVSDNGILLGYILEKIKGTTNGHE